MAVTVCRRCGKNHRTLAEGQCIDRHMSEKTLQDRVIDRAKRRGWKVAHAGSGWVGDAETGEGQFVTQMAKGWPDIVLAKPGHYLLFLELKRELGAVEEEQWEWLVLLNQCGARAVVIRPSDLREGKVNTILNVGSPIYAV